MKFRINVVRRANRDVDQILSWLAHHQKAPEAAVRWYRAFEAALSRLAKFGDQQPFAPENDLVDFELRHMTFKTPRGQLYRMLFTIIGDEVRVIHVRGCGQDLVPVAKLHLGE